MFAAVEYSADSRRQCCAGARGEAHGSEALLSREVARDLAGVLRDGDEGDSSKTKIVRDPGRQTAAGSCRRESGDDHIGTMRCVAQIRSVPHIDVEAGHGELVRKSRAHVIVVDHEQREGSDGARL